MLFRSSLPARLIPPSTDTEPHGGISLAGRLSRSRGRQHERAGGVQVPYQRRPEHACQEFAVLEWSDDEPTFTSTTTCAAHTRGSMSTVNGVRDISGLNIPLCQMVETGRREDQRPVDLAARHT